MVAPGRRWLGSALRMQSGLAATVIGCFSVLGAAGVGFGIGLQLGVLLGGIVLVGFPHGAFDHLVARPILRHRLSRRWWVPFLAGYLGLAGLVGLAWTFAPAATTAGFLAASVLHFGLGDTADGLAPDRVPRFFTLLTYGALPILLPAAFHPEGAAPVLAALARVEPGVMQHALSRAVWLLPAWAAAFAWIVTAAWRENRGTAERLATAAGFVLLPPLLAFGLYFGLGHSVRHVLRLGAWRDPWNFWAAMRWAARVILPAGVVCAAGLGGLALAGRDAVADLLAPGFQIIAALTLPHMIVTGWLDGSEDRPEVAGPERDIG
jgi:Brp/Blh family beta-carotene 15,15'-monooxygenase